MKKFFSSLVLVATLVVAMMIGAPAQAGNPIPFNVGTETKTVTINGTTLYFYVRILDAGKRTLFRSHAGTQQFHVPKGTGTKGYIDFHVGVVGSSNPTKTVTK